MAPKTKTKGADEIEATVAEEATTRLTRATGELAAASRLARTVLDPEDEPAPEPELSRLDTILATVQDQGKFEVYRQSAGGSKSKVGVFPIVEYPDKMEVIAAQYKGGTFTIIFKDAHGRIRGQDTQTFDAQAYSQGAAQPAAPAPTHDPAAQLLEKMLERMDARESAFRAEMLSMREAQSARELKFMEMMATRQAAPADSVNILEAIKLGREMAGPPQDPMSSLKGVIELASALREGAAPEEPKPAWLIALDKVMETLTPMISVLASKAVQQNPPASSGRVTVKTPGATSPQAAALTGPARTTALPSTAQPPAPSPEATAPPVPAAAEGAMLTPDPRMKEYSAKLLQAATVQMRPSIVAQLVVDAVSEDMVDDFEKMLEDTNLIPSLIAAEPRLGAHQAWLQAVMAEVEEKFDEKFPMEEEPAPAAQAAAPAPEPAPEPAPAPVPAPEPAPGPAPDAAASAPVLETAAS